MEYYIARHPVFNKRREIYGYKLELCPSLIDRYNDLYSEPGDAEELYRRLCFAGFDDSPERPAAILDYSNNLFDRLIPLFPSKHVILEFNRSKNIEMVLLEIRKAKDQGYRILYDATGIPRSALLQLIDLLKLDFSTMSLELQFERIKMGKGSVQFYASGIDTWEDFKKALVIGYDYFQGMFFLKPLTGRQSGLKSLNTSILRVMNELSQPEPGFKEITGIIEHDLSLSYNLLKLVNSTYIAPKFKVKTISQAVTILGLSQLNTFISSIMMKQIQSPETSELLRISLIRGKLMELLADSRKIPQMGSEAFFVGIFSLIDVILCRPIAEILDELPLTDGVKEALLGGDNDLKALLDMVRLYELARWDDFDAAFNLDLAEQEQLMNYFFSALKWAESFDL